MRFFFYYVIFTFVFLSLMWFVIEKGKTLKPHDNIVSTQIAINKYLDKSVPFKINSNVSVTDQFIHNMKNPLSMLLIQVVLILLISRMFGVLFSKFGQHAADQRAEADRRGAMVRLSGQMRRLSPHARGLPAGGCRERMKFARKSGRAMHSEPGLKSGSEVVPRIF